jgi:uncharacterized protein
MVSPFSAFFYMGDSVSLPGYGGGMTTPVRDTGLRRRAQGRSLPRRDAVLALLRAHERDLRAKGVVGLSLFGSTARGDPAPPSDVDLLLELAEAAEFGLFDVVELKDKLAGELGRPVDVVFRSRLRPWFAARIEPDLVRVF